MLKIAIHHRSGSFTDYWVEYCRQENISYKVVDAFDNDIVEKVKDCDAFMWHHHHGNFKDVLAAKKILFALEHAGIKVFPNFNTAWHFDDKVAQKYLLEAIDAPLVPSYIFYDKEEAQRWANVTTYPKVFKLKGGAGATNVKLVKSRGVALKLIDRAFSKGFSQFDRVGNLKEKIRIFKHNKNSYVDLFKGLGRLFLSTEFAKKQSREKGYAYFQEFIPDNDSDYRVIVIGNKAIAIKRLVRVNDFRASGSGAFYYERSLFDNDLIKTAFEVADNLKTQCCAFDFVYQDGKPLIVEISYGFASSGYDKCLGYWSKDLKFHKGDIIPYYWMIEELIK